LEPGLVMKPCASSHSTTWRATVPPFTTMMAPLASFHDVPSAYTLHGSGSSAAACISCGTVALSARKRAIVPRTGGSCAGVVAERWGTTGRPGSGAPDLRASSYCCIALQ
jgi:hypothetical protein